MSRSSSLPVDSEVTDSALASVSRQAEVSAPTREPEKWSKNILPVSSKDEGQDIRISTVEEDMERIFGPGASEYQAEAISEGNVAPFSSTAPLQPRGRTRMRESAKSSGSSPSPIRPRLGSTLDPNDPGGTTPVCDTVNMEVGEVDKGNQNDPGGGGIISEGGDETSAGGKGENVMVTSVDEGGEWEAGTDISDQS